MADPRFPVGHPTPACARCVLQRGPVAALPGVIPVLSPLQAPPHPQEPVLAASPRMLLPAACSKPTGAGTPLSTHHQMQLLQQLLQQQTQQTQVAVAQVLLSLLPSSQAPPSWA